MPDRRALVAVCCNQDFIYRKTAQSLMELGWGDRVPYAREQSGFDTVTHQWFTGSPRVDMLRNQAVDLALRGIPTEVDGPPVPFTHLVFLDADMVWPTDIIPRLLAHHDAGIVAGMYVLKGPPYSPVHLLDEHDQDGVSMFHRAVEFGRELVPVDVVGMGCTIIPVEAFRQTGASGWFAYADDAHGYPRVSEDVTFCQKARAAGIPRLMDPTIKCGHVGSTVFDERYHHRYQASIEAAKTMGPTVAVEADA